MAATAESCTGGLIAGLLTEIPGSSNMLERGFVVYSNAAKQELLGVPAETLASHGAVSEQTAVAMAEGALRASRAEVAVSVTGIAGPDGGTAAKPVGLVHFACARRGKPTVAREERFGAIGRGEVRLASVRVGARSSRGGAQPLTRASCVVGRSPPAAINQFGHDDARTIRVRDLARGATHHAARFRSLPKVHFPATQRGSFPAVTPTLGGRA